MDHSTGRYCSRFRVPLRTRSITSVSHAWQFDCESTALASAFTFSEHFSTVSLNYGTHDKQSEAGSLKPGHHPPGDTVKAPEDAFELRRGDANPFVLNSDRHLFRIKRRYFNRNLNTLD